MAGHGAGLEDKQAGGKSRGAHLAAGLSADSGLLHVACETWLGWSGRSHHGGRGCKGFGRKRGWSLQSGQKPQ